MREMVTERYKRQRGRETERYKNGEIEGHKNRETEAAEGHTIRQDKHRQREEKDIFR
jgi:hypothetical protein